MSSMKSDLGKVEHKVDKTYNLNKEKSTYVGDEIVKVKDYYFSVGNEEKVVSQNDFTISGGNVNGTGLDVSLEGKAGEEYSIEGVITYQNQEVYVVRIPGLKGKNEKINEFSCNFCALVTNSGVFLNKVIAGQYVQPGSLSISPSDTNLKSVSKEKIDYVKGYLNQELIYSGKLKDEIKITYREFTEEGLAKPAFYQDLSYDVNEPIIRFKNFRIEVLNASNEEIRFKVLDDGLD